MTHWRNGHCPCHPGHLSRVTSFIAAYDVFYAVARLLGEDFAVFKLPDGTYGITHERCPHRGASLVYGIVERYGTVADRVVSYCAGIAWQRDPAAYGRAALVGRLSPTRVDAGGVTGDAPVAPLSTGLRSRCPRCGRPRSVRRKTWKTDRNNARTRIDRTGLQGGPPWPM